MNREDALRKVQALLAKAESTDFEAEAEALMAKARDLMLAHSIDEMAARSRGERAAEQPVVVAFEFSTSDTSASGKGVLLDVAGRMNGVRVLFWPNRRGSNRGKVRADGTRSGVASQWCYLVGYESDVAMTTMTYASMLVQATRFGAAAFKSEWTKDGKSAYMTAFFMGFASRVQRRLDELKPVQSKGSVELVSLRDSGVDRAVDERFGNNIGQKNHSSHSDAGKAAGWVAGGKFDISSGKIGG